MNLYYNSPLKAKCPKMVNNKPRIALNKQEHFYKKIKGNIGNQQFPMIVFFKDYKKANVFGKNPFSSIFPNIASLIENYFPICLSVYEMPNPIDFINFILEIEIISNTVFYKSIEIEKEKGSFKSIEESQLKIIIDNQIDYIEVDKNTQLPKNILQLVKNKIINTVTGEKFYILNKAPINELTQ